MLPWLAAPVVVMPMMAAGFFDGSASVAASRTFAM
jgi:hypothetical protein